jgi:hypothetical protein
MGELLNLKQVCEWASDHIKEGCDGCKGQSSLYRDYFSYIEIKLN